MYGVKQAKIPALQTVPCRAGVSPALREWTKLVSGHFPQLSRSQACVLAWWSLGFVRAQACGLSSLAVSLAAALGRGENTVRQGLREFYLEAAAKAGERRAELEVEACCAPLLAWVLEQWTGRRLALALDATRLGQRCTVLCVSVLSRGCALPATRKAAWRPHWLSLLRHLRASLPRALTVIVLADRGRYAPWLFKRIRDLRRHPLLRVNLGGQFCPTGRHAFVPFKELVPHVGSGWSGRATAFKTPGAQLPCTLLACWAEGDAEPWLLLTDLPPENAAAAWYGLRAWIEQGFKLTKRAGWQ